MHNQNIGGALWEGKQALLLTSFQTDIQHEKCWIKQNNLQGHRQDRQHRSNYNLLALKKHSMFLQRATMIVAQWGRDLAILLAMEGREFCRHSVNAFRGRGDQIGVHKSSAACAAAACQSARIWCHWMFAPLASYVGLPLYSWSINRPIIYSHK